MPRKLRTLTLSALVAGVAALIVAPPADANRGGPGYVPGQNAGATPTTLTIDLDQEDPEGTAGVLGNSETATQASPPSGSEPAVTSAGPGADASPEISPASEVDATGVSSASPGAARKGILSRTGTESVSLVRLGLAAVGLGAGFVLLGRRRTGMATA